MNEYPHRRWTIIGQGASSTPLIAGPPQDLAVDEAIELMPVDEHVELVEDLTTSRATALGYAAALAEALRRVLDADGRARGVLREYDEAISDRETLSDSVPLFARTDGASALVRELVRHVDSTAEAPLEIRVNGEPATILLFDPAEEDVLFVIQDDVPVEIWVAPKGSVDPADRRPLLSDEDAGNLVEIVRSGEVRATFIAGGEPPRVWSVEA